VKSSVQKVCMTHVQRWVGHMDKGGLDTRMDKGVYDTWIKVCVTHGQRWVGHMDKGLQDCTYRQ